MFEARSQFANMADSAQEPQRHSEGVVARAIEDQTARLPSDAFLWGALGAMGIALYLQSSGRRHDALFFGQWAAPLLIMGLYNKVVKVAGTDRVNS